MSKNLLEYNLPPGYTKKQAFSRAFRFLKDPISFISKSMETYSGTYSAKIFDNRTLILTQDSEFVRYVLKENHSNYQKSKVTSARASKFLGKGLLFNYGENWLRQRRLIQPGFHKQKISELNDIIIKSIDSFLNDFPIGEQVDVYPLMHQLTFNVVINSLFDIDLSTSEITKMSKAFTSVQKFLFEEANNPWQKFFYPITGKESKAMRNAEIIRNALTKIVDNRICDKKSYGDLLDMLLNAKYEDTGENMSKEQVIDEILVLIFAGHETTSNTLSWLLYLLSENQSSIQKLRTRISGQSIHECIQDQYFNAIVYETMRMFPAAWMTERVSINDDSFKDYSFPKDTTIIAFFYGLHRSHHYWEKPHQFIPERFVNTDGSLIRSKNFFPFGAGPSKCLGASFAMGEMLFFMYSFFSKFTVTSTNHTPEKKAFLTLRPSQVLLKVHRL